MAIPFGVSVGDFIAAFNLVHGVYNRCFVEFPISNEQLRDDIRRTLSSLQDILSSLYKQIPASQNGFEIFGQTIASAFDPADRDDGALHALLLIVNDFRENIQSIQRVLRIHSGGNPSARREMRFMLVDEARIKSLLEETKFHIQKAQLALQTLNAIRSNEFREDLHELHRGIEQILASDITTYLTNEFTIRLRSEIHDRNLTPMAVPPQLLRSAVYHLHAAKSCILWNHNFDELSALRLTVHIEKTRFLILNAENYADWPDVPRSMRTAYKSYAFDLTRDLRRLVNSYRTLNLRPTVDSLRQSFQLDDNIFDVFLPPPLVDPEDDIPDPAVEITLKDDYNPVCDFDLQPESPGEVTRSLKVFKKTIQTVDSVQTKFKFMVLGTFAGSREPRLLDASVFDPAQSTIVPTQSKQLTLQTNNGSFKLKDRRSLLNLQHCLSDMKQVFGTTRVEWVVYSPALDKTSSLGSKNLALFRGCAFHIWREEGFTTESLSEASPNQSLLSGTLPPSSYLPSSQSTVRKASTIRTASVFPQSETLAVINTDHTESTYIHIILHRENIKDPPVEYLRIDVDDIQVADNNHRNSACCESRTKSPDCCNRLVLVAARDQKKFPARRYTIPKTWGGSPPLGMHKLEMPKESKSIQLDFLTVMFAEKDIHRKKFAVEILKGHVEERRREFGTAIRHARRELMGEREESSESGSSLRLRDSISSRSSGSQRRNSSRASKIDMRPGVYGNVQVMNFQ